MSCSRHLQVGGAGRRTARLSDCQAGCGSWGAAPATETIISIVPKGGPAVNRTIKYLVQKGLPTRQSFFVFRLKSHWLSQSPFRYGCKSELLGLGIPKSFGCWPF